MFIVSTRRRLATVALVAFSAAIALPARAAATAADIETARDQFNDGLDLRDQGDLRGALARLVVADKLVHTPITALEVGRTHVMLMELVEGVEALLSVARIPPSPSESANAAAARVEAAKLAADTALRIPSLLVTVHGAPATGLKVSLDGVALPIETLAAPRRLNPGAHVLRVSAPGRVDQQLTVTLKEEEARELAVTLVVAAAAVGSGPAPSIATDGGRTPLLAYLGFGVAGTGLVVGGITGALAFGKASRVKDECPSGVCTSEAGQADLRDGRTLSTVSTISFAVAGAGAIVGTLALLLRAPSSHVEPVPHARITPFIGISSVGLSGAF